MSPVEGSMLRPFHLLTNIKPAFITYNQRPDVSRIITARIPAHIGQVWLRRCKSWLYGNSEVAHFPHAHVFSAGKQAEVGSQGGGCSREQDYQAPTAPSQIWSNLPLDCSNAARAARWGAALVVMTSNCWDAVASDRVQRSIRHKYEGELKGFVSFIIKPFREGAVGGRLRDITTSHTYPACLYHLGSRLRHSDPRMLSLRMKNDCRSRWSKLLYISACKCLQRPGHTAAMANECVTPKHAISRCSDPS
jgi:hypothetical protein